MFRLSRPRLNLVGRLWSALTDPLAPVKPDSRPKIWTREGMRYYAPGAALLLPVLAVIFIVHWKGMLGWPGYINNDEGIYTEQAWSVIHLHRVTPYTYTYDHPDGAWMQIAAWAYVTFAFQRYSTAIFAGREFMLVVHMVASVFFYLLARRLGMRRTFAAVAVLLFSLSPLGLQFQRLVFIDNPAVMWAIIAMWFLASPWRSTYAAGLGGISFAFAILSKETILVLLPAVWLMRFDRRDPRNGRMCRVYFWSGLLLTVVLYYPLYAAIKGELLPGRGHVSLWGAIVLQLVDRAGSGSLLNPHSGTYNAAMGWVHSDPYILGVGLVAAVIALLNKRLRAGALAMVIQVLAMCRNGYLPFAYATALFPFAALSIAGVADWLWTGLKLPAASGGWNRWSKILARSAQVSVGTAMALALVLAVGSWRSQLTTAMDAAPNNAAAEATDYIVSNLPPDAKIITVDNAWTNLEEAGRHPISEYKADLDPTVHRELLPNGWESVDYVLLDGGDKDTSANLFGLSLPTVAQARSHSVEVASFDHDTLVLWKVVKPKPNSPNG